MDLTTCFLIKGFQGCIPAWQPQGGVHVLLFPASGAAHIPWLMASFFHGQSQPHCISICLSQSCLPVWIQPGRVLHLYDQHVQTGPSQIIQGNSSATDPSLHHICQVPSAWKVTCSASRDQNTGTPRGCYSTQPTSLQHSAWQIGKCAQSASAHTEIQRQF